MPNYKGVIMSHALAVSKQKHTPSVKLHIRCDEDLDNGSAVDKVLFADLWLSENAIERTAKTLRDIGWNGSSFEELNGSALEGTEVEVSTAFEDYTSELTGETRSMEKVSFVNPVGSYANRGLKPVADDIAKRIARKYDSVLMNFRASGNAKKATPKATAQGNGSMGPDGSEDDDLPF